MAPPTDGTRTTRSMATKGGRKTPPKRKSEEVARRGAAVLERKIKKELIEGRPARAGGGKDDPVPINDQEEEKKRPRQTKSPAAGQALPRSMNVGEVNGIVGVANVRGNIHFHRTAKEPDGVTTVTAEKVQTPSMEMMRDTCEVVGGVDFLKEFEEEIDLEVERKYATLEAEKDRGGDHNDPQSYPREEGQTARKEKRTEQTETEGRYRVEHTANPSEPPRSRRDATTKVHQGEEPTDKPRIPSKDNVSPQKKSMKEVLLTEPTIVQRKHSYRLQFSFHTSGPPATPVQYATVKAQHLHRALSELLHTAQMIDSTFVINTWRKEDKSHSIQKREDIPTSYAEIKKYIRPPPGGKMKSGTINWYWSVNVTVDIEMNRFISYWSKAGREQRKEERPLPVRPTPLQAEEWHECGWFVGSTADQVTDELLQGLQAEVGDTTLGMNWQSILFPGSNRFWATARERGKQHGNAAKFVHAPMALQILVDDRAKIKPTLKALYTRYGRVNTDGSWANLPDGSRMRYVPNFQFTKDMVGKERITKRMQLQIQMHCENRTFPIPVKDPSVEVEVAGAQVSLGKLILEEMCKEEEGTKINEPFFRHFVKRWKPNPEEREYDIAVHQHMASRARKKLKTLVADMVTKYGDSIKQHMGDQDDEGSEDSLPSEMEDMGLDDGEDDNKDMYLNGTGTTFVFLDMNRIETTAGPGPGGDQSDIAFTVKTGGTRNQTEASEEKEDSITTSKQTKVHETIKKRYTDTGGAWHTVKYGVRNQSKGQRESPHRKAKDTMPRRHEGP